MGQPEDGERLAGLIGRAKLSPYAVAKAIGVAPNTIARYERGEMAAPLTVLLAVDRVC